MGQHKIAGASKGPGYKKDQKVGLRIITFHTNGAYPMGSIFRMDDNRQYGVAPDGSYRRLGAKRGPK